MRVTVEVLLRTGLRVGEFTSLPADAVVQIGAAPWLHVPVGKLREDRYLPLHPHLVQLIDDYRTAHVRPNTRCCCPGRTAEGWTGASRPRVRTVRRRELDGTRGGSLPMFASSGHAA